MALTISIPLLRSTKSEALASHRKHAKDYTERDYEIDTGRLDDAGLADLAAAATALGDKSTLRVIEAIQHARNGHFAQVVPKFPAFKEMLDHFLRHDLADGWLYAQGPDGKLYPELVTEVVFSSGRNYRSSEEMPTVTIRTAAYTRASDRRATSALDATTGSHVFRPADVVRKTVADALASQGLFKETPELRAAYDVSMQRYRTEILPRFGGQFRINGAAYAYEENGWGRRGEVFTGRRAIHDLRGDDCGAVKLSQESDLFGEGVGAVPEHPLLRVFDLKAHELVWVHSDNVSAHVYDKSLRDKIVLPATHRDLLDVLTSEIDAFTSDIVEDKAAGNVILCKGPPGVGKTLTPTVFAELMERPLYAIHSGQLGTTAEQVEKGLEEIFAQANRWNCVLLLDEADVFVMQRGNSIEQNAIVAEFLRVLESFKGLMFMTTNRPDDIDEAIIMRCAAIIDYAVPPPEDTAAIWRVLAEQFEAKMPTALVRELVALFPGIAPRDIKMLLRLALRVAARDKAPLTTELFRRCAMFRAVKMADPAA